MSIVKIKDAANIPSEQLEDWGTPKTIGEPICQLRGLFICENNESKMMLYAIRQRSRKQIFNFGDVCGSGSAAAADNGGAGLQPAGNIPGVTDRIKI